MRLWLVATSAIMALIVASCGKPGATDSDGGATAPAASATAPAQPTGSSLADIPKRKEGLWTQTMDMDGKMRLTSRFCIDSETDQKMKLWGDQSAKSDCSADGPHRGLDGSFSFTSTCHLDGGITTVSTGTASGDFSSAYKVTMDTQTRGGPAESLDGHHTMTLSATYDGACPTGWKPGDMELPGGMRVNVMNAGKASSMPSGVPDMSQIRKMTPEQAEAMAKAMRKQMGN